MKKFIIFILLSVVSISAFADTTASSLLGCGGAPFACAMLSKIFGNVAPLTAHNGVLNEMMKVINVGLSGIIGIYCGYASLSATHEVLKGGLQNVQTQLAMPFLRLALALSLLVPIPNSGYSSYQTVVMNVAVAGADLANQVWNSALTAVVGGLRISPSTNAESKDNNTYYYNGQSTNVGNPYGGSTGIFTTTQSNTTGLAVVKNHQYVQAIFEHALCYEESQAYEKAVAMDANNMPGYTSLPMPTIDPSGHYLLFPVYGNGKDCQLSGENQAGTNIYGKPNQNYLEFPTAPSGYASSKSTLVKQAGDAMALNIFATVDQAAKDIVSLQQQDQYSTGGDSFFSTNIGSKPASKGDISATDAITHGALAGTLLAKAELIYVNGIQDVIAPAAENNIATVNSNYALDDSALSKILPDIPHSNYPVNLGAKNKNALSALLPSKSTSIGQNIASNEMASFMNAGSFFFQLANANQKNSNYGTTSVKTSMRAVACKNTSLCSANTVFGDPANGISNQYRSFIMSVIGGKTYAAGASDSADGTLFNFSFNSKESAALALDNSSTLSGANAYVASAVASASAVLHENYKTISADTPKSTSADDMSTDNTATENQIASAGRGAIPFIGPLMAMVTDFSTNNANPWAYAQNMGRDMIEFALGVIVVPPIVLGLLKTGTTMGLAQYFVNIKAGEEGVYNAIHPMMMAIGCSCLVSGIMLLFVVPMIPYFMFTLAIINWLLLVIEAMVAAPLVAVLIAHPDGHHFWGKAEVAWTLLLNLLIYPTLLIVGMVLCLALVYVGLNVLNITFATAIWNTQTNVGVTGFGQITLSTMTTHMGKGNAIPPILNTLTGLGAAAGTTAGIFTLGLAIPIISGIAAILAMPVVIMLYTMLVMAIVKECSNLIHILPSKVSRWIGVQGEQSTVGQAVQQAQQGMQQPLQATLGSRYNFEGAEKGMKSKANRLKKGTGDGKNNGSTNVKETKSEGEGTPTAMK